MEQTDNDNDTTENRKNSDIIINFDSKDYVIHLKNDDNNENEKKEEESYNPIFNKIINPESNNGNLNYYY